mmetsp:Transcript_52629/g.115397  ORF Transcript_52629/g.115397 Transcript_52629/m.115397 type:complete len:162 (-) Transcript_52629:10-495(-)
MSHLQGMSRAVGGSALLALLVAEATGIFSVIALIVADPVLGYGLQIAGCVIRQRSFRGCASVLVATAAGKVALRYGADETSDFLADISGRICVGIAAHVFGEVIDEPPDTDPSIPGRHVAVPGFACVPAHIVRGLSLWPAVVVGLGALVVDDSPAATASAA